MFQKTGSFKPRPALNKRSDRVCGREIVSRPRAAAITPGVAYAARERDLRATILMPRNTPANYLEAMRDRGSSQSHGQDYEHWRGGLIAGVAIAVRSVQPEVRIRGVETEGAELCRAPSPPDGA
jgi:threonine dehydratase